MAEVDYFYFLFWLKFWRNIFNIYAVCRAVLTIGLGGAEAPGPEQGGGPWLAVGLTGTPIAKATTPPTY